jgi:hypothetical protein
VTAASSHRGAVYEWPATRCAECGVEFCAESSPSTALYCGSRCRMYAAARRRADESPRAELARACARLVRAMNAARGCSDVELLHDLHGPASIAREAFAEVFEAGLPLFSASFEETRRLWGAQKTLDAEDRGPESCHE